MLTTALANLKICLSLEIEITENFLEKLLPTPLGDWQASDLKLQKQIQGT